MVRQLLSPSSIFGEYGKANNKKSFAVLKDHFFVDNSFILFLDLAVAFPICREENLSFPA
jgi:hypothetical protein